MDRNLTLDTTIKLIFDCIFGLLLTPEIEDPLDNVKASEYLLNREIYNQKALVSTNLHSRRTD